MTRVNKAHMPYGAYYKTDVPDHDPELTHTDRGTPMGEYMRRHWQPVCLSEQLTDVPKAIRILGEDLVAFRDRSGRVGVLQRHCSHRGASLEFGIIQPKGIRCCLHGWVYDIDGTLLETPVESEGSRLKETVCQGAYPAFERDGLVFAYMGPPEDKPVFPDYGSYYHPEDNKLVAISVHYPCNWLQVHENVIDHLHVQMLHNPQLMTVEGATAAYEGSNYATSMGFNEEASVEWETTRNGNGICWIACRRNPDQRTIWVRIVESIFPNHLQIGCTFPSARRSRRSQTVWTRWHVPIDDDNSLLIGWRHFNDEVDPDHLGRPEDCGLEKLDFMDGMVGNRSYGEGQRAPGDYEALVSMRPIAIHALENPGASDKGVYQERMLLRDILRGKTPSDTTQAISADGKDRLHIYTQDSVVNVPMDDGTDDIELMRSVGRQVLAIVAEGDRVPSERREAHIRARLDEFDGGYSPATE